MVKNHQHGAIGAVKHGSGDHLRDQVAKRSRLGDAATEGLEPAQHERLAAVCAREHVHLTSEIAEGSAFGALIEALSAPHCRATTVDMQRLGIGPERAKHLAAAIASNTSLRRLEMERNGIGVQGGMSLGDAIGRNQTLTRLNLSLNDIAPEGGASLARGLRSNTSLTQLTPSRPTATCSAWTSSKTTWESRAVSRLAGRSLSTPPSPRWA